LGSSTQAAQPEQIFRRIWSRRCRPEPRCRSYGAQARPAHRRLFFTGGLRQAFSHSHFSCFYVGRSADVLRLFFGRTRTNHSSFSSRYCSPDTFGATRTETNAISYFAPTIFSALVIIGNANSLLATSVYGIMKLCHCAIFITLLADRLGRCGLLCGQPLPCGSVSRILRPVRPSQDRCPDPSGWIRCSGQEVHLYRSLSIQLGAHLLDLCQ